MRSKDLIIMMLIFGAVITGMTGFYSDAGEQYGVQSNTLDELNQETNISSQMSTINEKVYDSPSDLGVFDIPGIGPVLDAIKTLKDLPKRFTTVMRVISEELGIPVWVTSLVGAIIGVIIAFAVITHFTKVDA